ncbi:MAG: hypothetical protein ACLUUO_08095 [Sellimonas intestinalis]
MERSGDLFGIATSNGRTLAEAALKALRIEEYLLLSGRPVKSRPESQSRTSI